MAQSKCHTQAQLGFELDVEVYGANESVGACFTRSLNFGPLTAIAQQFIYNRIGYRFII